MKLIKNSQNKPNQSGTVTDQFEDEALRGANMLEK